MEIIRTYRFWAGSSVVLSALLVTVAPRFTIIRSFALTAIFLFMLQYGVYNSYMMLIYPHYISPLRHLPTPGGNSRFNGQWSTIISQPSGQPMREWVKQLPNDGLIRYLHLFNRERLLLTSSKALSEVLVTKNYEFIKPELVRLGVGRILGFGILFAEGEEHKLQRKHLSPAFSFRHIKELYPQFWAKSQQMTEAIQAELQKQSSKDNIQEIGDWASRATLDIIGVSGMGKDFGAIADPNSELSQVYQKILRPNAAARIMGLLGFFLPNYIIRNLPVKRNDDIRHAVKIIRSTAGDLIKSKQERLARKETLHKDIVSVAVESGAFTPEQLIDNMMTFLAAGHETTASSFTWCMYMLAQNPDLQTKLRHEVRAHIPSLSAESVTHETIDNIAYLRAVCQETLRFYPPVPLTLREAAVDTTILDQHIPKGTTIVLTPWSVNHDTTLWGPDADKFNPDRWLAPGQANAGGASSNFAFLTFLHGPRSCIGQKFATAELACLVAAFVGRFEFELADPNEEIIIKGGITARPKNGMHLKLKVVEGW